MNFKSLTRAVTSKLSRQALVIQKHSPTIMFVAGTVGVVTAAVLACRATLYVNTILNDHEKMMDDIQEGLDRRENNDLPEGVTYTDKDASNDKLAAYAHTISKFVVVYGPSVVLGAISIGLLTRSHIVLNRRNTAIMAAYAAIDKAYREYRQRVSDEFGADKEKQLRYGLEERTIVEETDKGTKKTTARDVVTGRSPYGRMWAEETTKSWDPNPEYNVMRLRAQQNYANDLLKARGHLFLNEVYDMLGLERSREGAVVGWIYNPKNPDHLGDNYVDFGVFEGDRYSGMRFVLGHSDGIYLDFNVDGVIWDKI